MNYPERRILFIGLDGADLTYMRPWLDEGKLPNIARLVEDGALMPLASTICPFTNVAWPALFTGKNPGKTGSTDITLRKIGSHAIYPATLRQVQTEPFWVYLGEHDLRTLVINVPMVYPPHPLKGLVITGLDTPERAPNYAWPDDIQEQLEQREYRANILNPQHMIAIWSSTHRRSLDQKTYLEACQALTQNTITQTSRLLAEQKWDVAFIGYHPADFVNHYTANEAAHLQVYQMADELVGRLIDQVGDEATIILASDHGSRQTGRCVGLARLFADMGLMSFKPVVATEVIPWIISAGLPRRLSGPSVLKAVERIWDSLPEWLQRLLSWLPLKLYPGWAHYYSNIDWSKTRAYVASGSGMIYINRSDVLPDGTVAPGPEYEALRDRLIASLGEIRDPITQKPVFRVHRTEDIWHGPWIDAAAPDLILSLAEECHWIRQADARGRAFWDEEEGASGGIHRSVGTLILRGEGIKKGVTLAGANILDVTPTLLYLMKIPLPLELDGKLIKSALRPDFLKQHPIQMAAHARPDTYNPDETAYTEEDVESVLAKLRGLGYIE